VSDGAGTRRETANTRITVLPGDGIGPEVVDSALRVLARLGCGLEFDMGYAGESALQRGTDLIPQETLDLIERNAATLKGPITTPIGRGFSSVNVSLRQTFDLFANVRPILSMPGVKTRYENVDLVIVRENMEGLYSGVGQTISPDGERAEVRSVITRRGSSRLLRYAFDMARRDGRRKVTVVHKANVLKTTSGLWLDVARSVARDFADIEFQEIIVDNCAMQLVLNPNRFDVLVCTNLFGDILSDLCAGLVGGLGLAPGANIGERKGIFEAVHGSAPDIAGRNVANPTALVLASALMLDYLRMPEQARRVREAVRRTLLAGRSLTPDLGGTGTTTSYTDALLSNL
jgi:isocitrate dehydrogenase (NAD+)